MKLYSILIKKYFDPGAWYDDSVPYIIHSAEQLWKHPKWIHQQHYIIDHTIYDCLSRNTPSSGKSFSSTHFYRQLDFYLSLEILTEILKNKPKIYLTLYVLFFGAFGAGGCLPIHKMQSMNSHIKKFGKVLTNSYLPSGTKKLDWRQYFADVINFSPWRHQFYVARGKKSSPWLRIHILRMETGWIFAFSRLGVESPPNTEG